MPTGNNIPFMPGDYPAPRGGTPKQSFNKHRNGVGARLSDGAPDFKMGLASGGGQGDGSAALQRAAGKRLMHGKPGAFAANYARNSNNSS